MLTPKVSRGERGLAFEEIAEVRHIGKAQTIGDFRNVPVGLLQQYFGLLRHPTTNQGGGSAAGSFLQHPVEVVDVDGQQVGIVGGCPQAQLLLRRLERKLPFEQDGKQGG